MRFCRSIRLRRSRSNQISLDVGWYLATSRPHRPRVLSRRPAAAAVVAEEQVIGSPTASALLVGAGKFICWPHLQTKATGCHLPSHGRACPGHPDQKSTAPHAIGITGTRPVMTTMPIHLHLHLHSESKSPIAPASRSLRPGAERTVWLGHAGFSDPSSRVSAFDNRSGLAGSKGLAPIGRVKRLPDFQRSCEKLRLTRE